MAQSLVCEECRSEVSEQANTCPSCGYNPAKDLERVAKTQYILAAICFFTIIGSPLGLVFAWSAHKKRKQKKNASPGVPA